MKRKVAGISVVLVTIIGCHLAAEDGEPTFKEPGGFKDLTFEKALAALGDAPGNIAMGKLQFQQRCARCHVLEEGKPSIGPFMGMVADQKTREELLKSILFPAADIAFGFEVQRYTLADGKVYEGSIYEDTAEVARIATVKGEIKAIPKDKIASQEGLGTSLMPANVAAGMTVEHMRSLISFMMTLKSGAPAAK